MIEDKVAWQYVFRVPRRHLPHFMDCVNSEIKDSCTRLQVENIWRNVVSYDVFVTCFEGNAMRVRLSLEDAKNGK